MRREVDLKEISDGRLYGPNDMVKADCKSCEGCFACCRNMGRSVILDPLDMSRICRNLKTSLESLLQAEKMELNVVDQVILPNLKMAGREERCVFLSPEGRCSIHPFRPGLCRLFPLGRIYEGEKFQYFLQVRECKKKDRRKIKVYKWLDEPNWKEYEKFIGGWHSFLKEAEQKILQHTEQQKPVSLYILEHFYHMEYETDSLFFQGFFVELEKGRAYLEGSK